MDTNKRQLYRSLKNRMIAGVCAGLADYMDMDPTVMRLIFVLLFFATGTVMFWVYLIMAIIVPNEPAQTIEPVKTNEP